MVVSIRDIGNILFHTSAFNTSASNMASFFNIDIADDSVIGNIFFNNSNRKDEVRGHSSVSSMPSSRSLSSFSEKSTEEYSAKVQ